MKRVLGNLFWATAGRVADAAVRFVTVPLILGHFGKLQFGLLALVYSINVFLTLADFGLNINAIRLLSDRFHEQDWKSLRRLVHSCSFFYSIVGLVNLAGVMVVSVMAPGWFNLDPAQARDFLWMMATMGLGSWLHWSFVIHRQVIQAAGHLGWDERNTLWITAALAGLVGVTLHFDLSLVTYSAWSTALGALMVLMRWRKVRRLVPGLTVGFAPDWTTFKPLIPASSMILLMTLAQMMANNFRPLILGSQGTLEQVADYRIIQGVVSFALMVSGGVLNVVHPEVARLEARGDSARLRDLACRGTSLLLWGHLLLLVPLALASGLILELYVGPRFLHLAMPLALWLLTCAAGHNAIFSSVLLSRGKLGALTVSSIVNSAATLALAWVLVPAFGLDAVVWTYVLFVVLQAAFFYLFLVPPIGLASGRQLASILFKPIVGAALAAVMSIALTRATGLPSWSAGFFAALAIAGVSLSLGNVRGNLRLLAPSRAR